MEFASATKGLSSDEEVTKAIDRLDLVGVGAVAEGQEAVESREQDDDSDDDEGAGEGGAAEAGKKKRKKKKKPAKKKSTAAPVASGIALPHARCLGGYTDYFLKYGQTNPPTRPVAELFANGVYPEGEIQAHGKTKYPVQSAWVRETEEEKRENERIHSSLHANVRLAAECHRQTRAYAQSLAKPGIELATLCEEIENTSRRLINESGLQAGIGFPTGCSINSVAAHYTPNPGDHTVLGAGDVMKLDFGIQIQGRIIDCAFTVAFDEKYDPLLLAVKEATNTGLKAAGIDMQLGEIGEAIQEVMESHEITLNGITYPIKCCRNLNGHSIGEYQIHGGKSVPIVGNGDTTRMEENEFYAIETFGSTGKGYVIEHGACSHYMKDFHAPHVPLKTASAKNLLKHINKTFSTLAFCRRWLERDDGGSFTVNGYGGKQENYLTGLKSLCDAGIVNAYPPLVDIPGSYVAQYEHTFLLRPTCKEILSRGDDF